MGSEKTRKGKTEHKIPVVEFSSKEEIKVGSDSWEVAREKVLFGFEEYGSFEIIMNDFTNELHNNVFGAAKELLDLPMETKTRKTTTRPGAKGYLGNIPAVPLYESLGIENADTPHGAEYFTNIMWPQGNPTFRETVNSFAKRLADMTEMTMRMVVENYGVKTERFGSLMESKFHVLRFIKYRMAEANETNVGMGAHSDSNFITILHQHQVEGLEVKAKDGQWIQVKPSPSSFLVLAGEPLMAWSNDRIRACVHQVTMKENRQVRYSVGLFTPIKGILQVPEELVDDEHPLRYKPFDNCEFLLYFFTEEARKFENPIKGFCGI